MLKLWTDLEFLDRLLVYTSDHVFCLIQPFPQSYIHEGGKGLRQDRVLTLGPNVDQEKELEYLAWRLIAVLHFLLLKVLIGVIDQT